MDVGYFDGAVEPTNPGGTGGWGYHIHDSNGVVLLEDCGIMKAHSKLSNNVAEYVAAIRCVEGYVKLKRPGPVIVRGDSMMVVKQMLGEWRIKRGFYVPFAYKLRKMCEDPLVSVLDIRFQWVPREKNGLADDLSKRKLQEAGVQLTDWRA